MNKNITNFLGAIHDSGLSITEVYNLIGIYRGMHYHFLKKNSFGSKHRPKELLKNVHKITAFCEAVDVVKKKINLLATTANRKKIIIESLTREFNKKLKEISCQN